MRLRRSSRMRLAPTALACAAALCLATRARATCMEVDCEASLTHADGSPIAQDEAGWLHLAAGEPFLYRHRCDQVCSAPGGPVHRSEEAPRAPVAALLGRGGLRCPDVAVALRSEATADRFAFVAFGGLPPGRYQIDGWRLVVGDAPETECPYAPPPPPWVPPTTTGGEALRGPSWERDWDDRRGLTWEAGVGPWLGVWGEGGRGAHATPGAVALFGLHTMVRYPRPSHSEKGGDWPEWEGTRWCAPILCMGIGMLFAPSGVLLGNEIGVELRTVGAASTSTGSGGLFRGTARPFFRYARGALRTPSFVGVLLPEVGAEWQEGRGASFAMAWSLFPIDWRFAGPISLSVDPLRAGLLVSEAGRVASDLGGEITLRFAP